MLPSDATSPQHSEQISAGGVLYRQTPHGLEVCLIAKHAGRVWALPKGRLDTGESPEEAAVREVLEETGHGARIVERVGSIEYEFLWKSNNTIYHKNVTYFLMALERADAQARDSEADEVAWVALSEAARRVTHENERSIVKKARQRLENPHE